MARVRVATGVVLIVAMLFATAAFAAEDAGATPEAPAAEAPAAEQAVPAGQGGEPAAGSREEDVMRTAGRRFLGWLDQNGFDVSHVSLMVSGAGATLIARDDVPAGTNIAVPGDLVLNADNVGKRSPAFAAAVAATAERGLVLPSDISTAVALMYETFHNPSSFWTPYTALIPLRLAHPFFYTSSDIELASSVPAVARRILGMRETLLSNFKVLYDSMLTQHPEVFGEDVPANEADGTNSAFEAWRSQYAWATAVVSVHGFSTFTQEGAHIRQLVPVLDAMALELGGETTVTTDTVDGVTSYGHSTPRALTAGEPFTVSPTLHVEMCNMDTLLTYGVIVNDTTWDCAYIWHRLPTRTVGETGNSIRTMVWNLYNQLGHISDDILNQKTGDASAEVVYRWGHAMPPELLQMARLAALVDGDFDKFENVVAGNLASIPAEHRALSGLIGALRADQKLIRERVSKLVTDGVLAENDAEWTDMQTLVALTISGILRSMDSVIVEAQKLWLGLLEPAATEA